MLLCTDGQVLCVVLLVWAVLQVATACVGLANKSSVWESELEFNTHGLSVFQLLAHLYLVRARETEIVARVLPCSSAVPAPHVAWRSCLLQAALAVLGFVAHAKKDAYKAQIFVSSHERSSTPLCLRDLRRQHNIMHGASLIWAAEHAHSDSARVHTCSTFRKLITRRQRALTPARTYNRWWGSWALGYYF
jgi:hypothetical protein